MIDNSMISKLKLTLITLLKQTLDKSICLQLVGLAFYWANFPLGAVFKKCDIAQFLSFIWEMRQIEIFGTRDTYRSIDDVTDSWISIPFSHSPNECNIKQMVTLLDFL